MLDHQRRDRWDLNHLMPQWLWIISLEQGAAAAARRIGSRSGPDPG
jgi:hypothetical protein